jgi:hypothetical protein
MQISSSPSPTPPPLAITEICFPPIHNLRRSLSSLHSSCCSWCSLLQLGGSPTGVGQIAPPPPGIQVRASSSTSGDGFNFILRLPVCFKGLTGPSLTDALSGQSIQVHASTTPLRLTAGGYILSITIVIAAYLFRSRALM